MKKQHLVNGYFSSVPLAVILTATADIAPEDEVRDDGAATAATEE
jgi:hypothetical protein